MSKRSSLKLENYFVAVLSPLALSPYKAQMFLAASAAFAPLLNSKRRIGYVGNVPISPLCTPFSSVHGSTHSLQMTKLQHVNSSITIEFQIGNDSLSIVLDLGFTTLLTSQVISVAFYSEREKSDNFCSEALISA